MFKNIHGHKIHSLYTEMNKWSNNFQIRIYSSAKLLFLYISQLLVHDDTQDKPINVLKNRLTNRCKMQGREKITVITIIKLIENGTNNKEGGRIDNQNSGIIQGRT